MSRSLLGNVGVVIVLVYIVLMYVAFSALIFIIAFQSGYTVTFPPDDPHLGYQPGPATRGTITIITSCLLTILSCTYVMVHPPIHPNSIIYTRYSLAMIGFVVPELLFGIAFMEFLEARDLTKQLKSKGYTRWTLRMSFVAAQEGFTGRSRQATLGSADDIHRFVRSQKLSDPTLSIDYDRILLEIKDRSKQDSLGKVMAAIQIVRLALQVVARAAEKVSTTPLELVTVGYVLMAVAMYALWWRKPYCMNERIRLRMVALNASDGESDIVPDGRPTRVGGPDPRLNQNWARVKDRVTYHLPTLVASALVIAAFGGVHLAAWNFTFINSGGKSLWRISCIIQLVLLFSFFSSYLINPSLDGDRDTLTGLIFKMSISVYIVIRLVLFALVVLSFWALPQDAYKEVNWLYFVPQWS